MLAVAAGVGLTATFGTPIGGCVYSIETVMSFISVTLLSKSLFASVATATFYFLLMDWLLPN